MAKASTGKVLAFGRICTSGQSVQNLVGAPLVVSLGLLQSGIVEYLVKLDHLSDGLKPHRSIAAMTYPRQASLLHGWESKAASSES